jgi:hypothetical protein
MAIIISKYIETDTSFDDLIEWVIQNCSSFEKYMLVELDWEERVDRGCWFRFDVYFNDERDAMLYTLRWT